jgi:hypothetical protein
MPTVPPRSIRRLAATLVAAVALGLCRPPASRSDPAPQPPLLWVVDGAGDIHGCSTGLKHAAAMYGLAIEFAVINWGHGYRTIVKDQIDFAHAKRQGVWLADEIARSRREQPGRRIVLLAHSAGPAVALPAAERLPPGTLDRIILLAPSISTGYDVRPALAASREGMDVFCSRRDIWALGFGIRLVKTTDNRKTGDAAGRYGFKIGDCDGRLRQYFWSRDLAWTGHDGGHYGSYAPAHAKLFLFPKILGQ